MNTETYKIVESKPCPRGCVTAFNWCVGGTKRSTDGYKAYEIGVFQHLYLYRRKPTWFGHYDGDRYLGKLRWISRHCDGKQNRNITRRGSIDKWTVNAGEEKESERIATGLVRTYGFTEAWFYPDLREERRKRYYFLSIRCSVCGQTCSEVRKIRQRKVWDLTWPKDWNAPRMDTYDAQDLVRRQTVCKCN